MASESFDWNKLKNETINSGASEDAVTVNFRALIDKVLARYAKEFTTFRELIQNAADASATKVSIHFDTLPALHIPAPSTTDRGTLLKHTILHHTVGCVRVTNNGEPFNAKDWARLKSIAEGNPDEAKIGAFGVGFYSVFEACDTPFISSGSETMAFFWKGNTLLTKKGTLPPEIASRDTNFVLENRDKSTILPNLLALTQFLSTSLTFVGLESIGLWVDNFKVVELTKKTAPSIFTSVPTHLSSTTKDGLLRVQGVEHQAAQIDAVWSNIIGWRPDTPTEVASSSTSSSSQSSNAVKSFFSRLTAGATSGHTVARKAAAEEQATQKAILEDLGGQSSATVFLRVSTANVQTYVSKTLSKELQRATKKPPPKHTRVAVLTSSYDQIAASAGSARGSSSAKAQDIFASILPTKDGKIFIGFETSQTTGLLAHISAPSVIPTVEREHIDLSNRFIKDWNVEILRAAGIACRVTFEESVTDLGRELDRLSSSSSSRKVDKSVIERLMPSGIYILQQFTFRGSTPTANVSRLMEEAFWSCSTSASIRVLSSCGVLPSNQVRLASEDLSFVDRIPVIPRALADGAKEFIAKMEEFHLITGITLTDITEELERQPLTEDQLHEFLRWTAEKVQTGDIDTGSIQALFKSTLATIQEDNRGVRGNHLLELGNIECFINPSKIPAELPVPPNTIPFRFHMNTPRATLEKFGWAELNIIPWLKFLLEDRRKTGLSEEQSMAQSSAFAVQILPVLSKNFDSLSASSKSTVVDMLATRTVIPTKQGLRKPSESYFSSITKVFEDLPTISGVNGVKDKFWSALGVRKTIDLDFIFDRLMAPPAYSEKNSAENIARWDHIKLIQYFAKVKDDIPAKDVQRLRETAFCYAEDVDGKPSSDRYQLSRLYEPKAEFRSLGLPILQWSGYLRPASPESRFMALLGLKSCPSVKEVIEACMAALEAGAVVLYEKWLRYYLDHWQINGYAKEDMSKTTHPFLPLVVENGQRKYTTPSACFTNAKAAAMNYPILRSDLRPESAKFGVASDPPIQDVAWRLISSPPRGIAQARQMFDYLADRLPDIQGEVLTRLSQADIVPIVKKQTEKRSEVGYIKPQQCFLGSSEDYGDVLDFVDFGEANVFLIKLGAKIEPTTAQLAEMTVREGDRLLATLGFRKYQDLLRRLAVNSASLKKDKTLIKAMKKARILLGYKEYVISAAKANTLSSGGRSADQMLEIFSEEGEEEATVKQWRLHSADQIIIVDDPKSFQLFKENIVAAPQEELLESLYAMLGSRDLTERIDREPVLGERMHDQEGAEKLRRHVVERSLLFLYDHPADGILHDYKWLERNLKTQMVASIRFRRIFHAVDSNNHFTHTDKQSAALSPDPKNPLLSVTPDYDNLAVSQALVRLLLKRPSFHSALLLENILDSGLHRLKARGYPVERIMRQRQAEARIVEAGRQERMEEEQRHRKEQEQKARENGTAQANVKTPVRMPGGFEDSPVTRGSQDSGRETNRPFNNFFTKIGKSLGIGDQVPDKPPEYGQPTQATGALQGEPGSGSSGTSTPRPGASKPQYNFSDIKGMEHSLAQAVRASRAHDSSSLYTRPETANILHSPDDYCDERSAAELVLYKTMKTTGFKVFIHKELRNNSPEAWWEKHKGYVNAFIKVLFDAGGIFGLHPSVMHVFYEEKTSRIAFNSNGSIFCNLWVFEQMYDLDTKGNLSYDAKVDALEYYYVTLAHELAHNIVSEHGAAHSYWTETFVYKYSNTKTLKEIQYVDERDSRVGAKRLMEGRPHEVANAPKPNTGGQSDASRFLGGG